MPKRGPCKFFFAHGACLKGEHCEFSHERKDPPNKICKFNQKGVCAYGSRCRYDHIKVSRLQSLTPWNKKTKDVDESRIASPSEVSICSSAAAGYCSQGEKCPHIHGDMCPTCRNLCLHPFHPEEREEHMKNCEILQKHLEALKQSLEIQCSICLERVLSKPTAAERKFGLLSECDHPFCISCIRKWHSRMDVNSTLRACPVCHKLSHFVIPSVISYATSEEKHEIIDSFKAKLKSIGCKHFDFDNGNCPFGTSCYYKYAYRDGILEPLLYLGAADCNTVIAEDVRLSDFLANMHLK